MKKILIIGNGIYPNIIGGTEIAIFEFAQRLINIYDLKLTITGIEKDFKRKALKNLNIFPIGQINFKNRYLIHLTRSLNLLKNLCCVKYDLLLCFDIFYYSFVSVLVAKILKKKIIVRSEGSDLNKLGKYFERNMKRFICRFADLILYTSHEHLIKIINFKPKYLPIILENGSNFSNDKNFINKPKDKIHIIFVGRLSHVKNISSIIEAMKYLNIEKPRILSKFDLKIYGDGPQKQFLVNLTKKNHLEKKISFLGRINHENIQDIYLKSDIFILSSFSEGFPLVIAESLRTGLAILCSRIPSLTHILKENENCLFFSPINPKEIANKINLLIDNLPLIYQMKMNNLKLGRKYSWNSISKKLIKIIEYIS